MKVLIFLRKSDTTLDTLQKLNRLIIETFSQDQNIVFEKVKVEDNPKLVKFYNVKVTPMTVIGSKRFPGIPTPEHVLEISRNTTQVNVEDKFEPGKVVLVKGILLSMVLSKVRELKEQGYTVLMITRTYPPALEKRYDLRPNEIQWLMPRGVHVNGITIKDIDELEKRSLAFLAEGEKHYLVIDGLDILATHYDDDRIRDFLNNIKSRVGETSAICFVVYLPNALDEKKRLAIIETLKG